MLTGRKAFEAKSQASLIAAIIWSEPPPVSRVRPIAPAALDRIVATCLAKDPDDRWQSARDLMRELRLGGRRRPARSVAAATGIAIACDSPWAVAALLGLGLARSRCAPTPSRGRGGRRPGRSSRSSLLPPATTAVRTRVATRGLTRWSARRVCRRFPADSETAACGCGRLIPSRPGRWRKPKARAILSGLPTPGRSASFAGRQVETHQPRQAGPPTIAHRRVGRPWRHPWGPERHRSSLLQRSTAACIKRCRDRRGGAAPATRSSVPARRRRSFRSFSRTAGTFSTCSAPADGISKASASGRSIRWTKSGRCSTNVDGGADVRAGPPAVRPRLDAGGAAVSTSHV